MIDICRSVLEVAGMLSTVSTFFFVAGFNRSVTINEFVFETVEYSDNKVALFRTGNDLNIAGLKRV